MHIAQLISWVTLTIHCDTLRQPTKTINDAFKDYMMPYVNIKITNEGATAEQKATLIEGVTKLLQETLNKNPATTVVVIEEVPTDNWGMGGKTVTEWRKKPK